MEEVGGATAVSQIIYADDSTFFKNNTLEAQKTADAMTLFTDFTGLEINAAKSTATMNRHGHRQETA